MTMTENAPDTRPIGVFDSGLGGLTAVRSLMRILPEESLIYFGDTARVPYGNRAPATILQYARQDVRFLRSFHLKAVVVACGTISTTSLDVLQSENPDLPFIGVVEPSCRRAADVTTCQRVGVIATRASIRSGAYESALHRLDPGIGVFVQSCPLFVPLVENGRFRPGDVVIETVAREYLAPLLDKQIDTLILGCTHYPLLQDVIAQICGPSVTLISAGEECAYELKRLLDARQQRAHTSAKGEVQFYVSDQTEDFENTASIFLRENLRHVARRVDIEQY